MSSAAAATAVLLSLFDPSGDNTGDGSYRLPSSLTQIERASLDLRSLEAQDVGGRLRVRVGFGGIANPLQAPGGFSVTTLDVFIKTSVGGQTTLGDSGFQTPLNSGWQYHLTLNGFEQRLERQLGGEQEPSRVGGTTWNTRVEGSALVIDTDLPAGNYGYWAMTRLYDPLTPGGFKVPSSTSGPYDLFANLPQSPPVVDLMLEGDQRSSYLSRTLPERGEVIDRRPLILLIVGALGLLLALASSWMVWRRP